MIARTTRLVRRAVSYIKTHKTQSILAGIVAPAALAYVFAFLVPHQITLNYAGASCRVQPVILPGIHKATDMSKYDVSFKNQFKVGTLSLVSFKTCVTPTSTPKEGVAIIAIAPFGGFIARTHFAIKAEEPPTVDSGALTKPFPASKPLEIKLSRPDTLFNYSLEIDHKRVACKPDGRLVKCDIPSLKLKQDMQYSAKLLRAFKQDKPTTLRSVSVRTLKATTIIDGTIKSGQIVYDTPITLQYTADKLLTSTLVTLKPTTPGATEVPVKSNIKGNVLTIMLDGQLKRETGYELILSKVEAVDGSTLVEPYRVAFSTSGGPKVNHINIGASKVAQSAVVVLDFDQPLSDKQPAESFVRLTGGAAVIKKVSSNRVTVTLGSLPRCVPFTIEVLAGLQSNYGISTAVPWKYSSRTICHTVSTIGVSLRGRPINAYTFGEGGSTTLFVGGLHGNEPSSSLLMQDWVNELEANYSRLPANTRVVVVPSINPDGIAANTRNNARNVNLNRNFPTNNWQSNINDTNGNVQGGGGLSPLSEPETQALATLSLSLRPRLMLSYHAVGSLVVGDPGGYSASYAARYASMVGYRNATGQSSSTFDYDITGSYEDWTIQKAGIPSIVVELGSYSYRNLSHHREALWSMLR